MNTLLDKISTNKIFIGQNFSTDRIFDTFQNFRQFCPTKIFVRRTFVRNLFDCNSCFYDAAKFPLLECYSISTYKLKVTAELWARKFARENGKARNFNPIPSPPPPYS